MRRAAFALAVILFLTQGSVARAWDPDGDPQVVDPPIAWAPEPPAVAPPDGIYLVTETYVDDVVTRSGPVTTYATETTPLVTGSYARVLETVPTGGASAFDGSAFNGRATLMDGRSVAGTYYENYVLIEGGFLPVSVVFFQDDSEIARAARAVVVPPSPPAAVGDAPVSTLPIRPLPATWTLPAAGIGGIGGSGRSGGSGGSAPVVERDDPSPGMPAVPRRATHLPDRSVEVLRGRRIALSFAAPDVTRWRFLSGEGVALGPVAGSAAEPFLMRWDVLAPPTGAWVLWFVVDYVDGTSGDLGVRVVVRAPGLVQ